MKIHPMLRIAGLAAFFFGLAGCGGGGGSGSGGGGAPVPAASITEFTAANDRVPSGGSTILTAVFVNGAGSIDNGIGAVTSGVPVTATLSTTTTYTLTVVGVGGPATQQLKIIVPDTFSATGNLGTKRSYGHTATLLANGKVLIAGGFNAGPLASAELYDPATGSFSFTGNLNTARYDHTATLLPSGQVLIVGGVTGLYTPSTLTSAELYDPVTGTFSPAGDLNMPRFNHTATLLSNGKVLFAGGNNASTMLTSAELYDPTTKKFSFTGSLKAKHYGHTATLLLDGKVLVLGGYIEGSPELYDPATGVFTLTGSLNVMRYYHTATLLPSGKVLITGGDDVLNASIKLASSELYDPVTQLFSMTGNLNIARNYHTATLLDNGLVLIAGGYNNGMLDSAERYDPATGVFTSTVGKLVGGRQLHTATLLPNDGVLLTGGVTLSDVSAELYDY